RTGREPGSGRRSRNHPGRCRMSPAGNPRPSGRGGGQQSTYRVQLSRAFPFAAARAVVPYLADLSVSHLYTSPVLRARSGSAHGYDVVDPTPGAPELGGGGGRAG